MNRVLYTYDDLSRSDASLPTSLVSSITYVMRCRRYVMTMTRQTRRTIGGIAVTVSIPHRFPYGSLLLFSLSLFFLRHARTVIVDLTDRSLLLRRISTKPTVYPSREASSAVAVILKATTVRDRSVVHACYPSTSAIRTSTAIFARGASQRCIFLARVVRRIKETAMAVA